MPAALIARSARSLGGPLADPLRSAGLLILRVTLGVQMLALHGWPKLTDFSDIAPNFPDPIGVGSQLSLALAVAAEVGASILIVLGLATRLAAVPFAFTMLVAAFIVHGADPWSDRELALVYLGGAVTLVLAGPGGWSLDRVIAGRLLAEPDPKKA